MIHVNISRFLWSFTSLSLVVACGAPASSDADHSEDGVAAGGSSSGIGGADQGSGGAVEPGVGGADLGAGGTVDPGTGGAQLGAGGLIEPGAGGAGAGSGGAPEPGTGGVTADTGGADGAGGDNLGPSGCAAADILCVDFEDTAVGSKPSGSPWDPDGCTDPNYSAEVTAGSGVDGTQGFVTSNAASSANTCALFHSLDGTADFWVTLHLKIGGTNPDMEHEVTFFELGEALQDDPELRIGYRGDSSCGNMGQPYQGFELGATQSASGEFTGCTGSKTLDGIPVVDTWYCLETHVDQSSGSVVADLFIDGVDQSFLVHSNPEENVRGNFPVNFLKVGMQSYSGVFQSLTIDDLSISSTRVGCD